MASALSASTVRANAILEGTSFDRHGSSLGIDWDADDNGTWQLLDTDGHVCASGRVTQGQNHIGVDKISAPTDVRFEVRPDNGSVPSSLDIAGIKHLSPLPKLDRGAVIYQLPPRTFLARNSGQSGVGKLNDLTDERLREIKAFGADYLWVTGIMEHASRAQNDADVVKGDAGSYYAIYDSWDVSQQIGTLADFEALIDRAHDAGLRILIDFVGNHTARVHRTDVACKQHLDFGRGDRTDQFFDANNNYYYMNGTSFTPPGRSDSGVDGVFDTDIFTPGTQLETPAKVTGNNVDTPTPQPTDWFETAKLNYGWDFRARRAHYSPRPRTWDQMLDVARYWVEKGVDGFRLDFAHAVPIEFWRYFATELRRTQPNVFLLAEAYESDYGMRLPGFSYFDMLDAGIDSIYDSDLYRAIRAQVDGPADMRVATPNRVPAYAQNVVDRGFMFTHYLENHDELRVASRPFAQFIGDRGQRADIGMAYTAYLGLMPGNLMLHAGQELQEDASIAGGYSGNENGKTSIFDFVYQSQSRTWNYGQRPQWMIDFRQRYQELLALKKVPAFGAPHKTSAPSMIDLDAINGHKDQSKWISSYLRFGGGEAYLVVANSDPFVQHEATVHLTSSGNQDSHGALAAAGIANDTRRYVFREVYARKDWIPHDPAVDGDGVPGWALFRPGDIPSGVFLGAIPPATTYVFKIEAR